MLICYEKVIDGIRYEQWVKDSDAAQIAELERNGWKPVQIDAPKPEPTPEG